LFWKVGIFSVVHFNNKHSPPREWFFWCREVIERMSIKSGAFFFMVTEVRQNQFLILTDMLVEFLLVAVRGFLNVLSGFMIGDFFN